MPDIDAYISSIKKIYLTLFLLVLSVTYFSTVEYQRKSELKLLEIVDLLLTVQEITKSFDDIPVLKGSDIPEIYIRAGSDLATLKWDLLIEQKLGTKKLEDKELLKELEKFSDYEIKQGRLAKNKRFRTAPGEICNIALFAVQLHKKPIILEQYTYRKTINFDQSDV